MLRKTIYAILIVLLTTAIVSVQMPKPGVHLKDDKPSRTKEQKQYDKALDRAYQSTIKEIPEPKKKSDPWGDIRPSPGAAVKNKQQ
jgi:uncharacterized protein YecT (DUF1311 family)